MMKIKKQSKEMNLNFQQYYSNIPEVQDVVNAGLALG